MVDDLRMEGNEDEGAGNVRCDEKCCHNHIENGAIWIGPATATSGCKQTQVGVALEVAFWSE